MKQDLLQKQGLLQLAWHEGRSLHAGFAVEATGLYATEAPSKPRPSTPARRIFFFVVKVMPKTRHKLISTYAWVTGEGTAATRACSCLPGYSAT
jgi:hypothetical protein